MAMIHLVENVTQYIDNKKYTLGVFTDLKKAFDTSDHKIQQK